MLGNAIALSTNADLMVALAMDSSLSGDSGVILGSLLTAVAAAIPGSIPVRLTNPRHSSRHGSPGGISLAPSRFALG